MTHQRKDAAHASVPLWRDVRVLAIAFQAVVLVVVLAAGAFLVNNALTAMDERGFLPSLDFLSSTAGFDVATPLIDYDSTDNYARALTVGLLSTLLVSLVGIFIATLVGLMVGVARLSHNWLVAKVALAYVELFRNTPLLLQLIVIYFAVFLQLPPAGQAIALPGSIYFSKSGIDMPDPSLAGSGGLWLLAIAAAVATSLAVWYMAGRREANGQPPGRLRLLGVLVVFAVPVVGWFVLEPVMFTEPELGRFKFVSGFSISAEFTALTLGLALYTAAFIAEIVRGAIESVSKGQLEAARAIGLRESETLRLVILPQALRVIIPPLTGQYLNLIKNSSLAIVIGFQDIFAISKTIITQTGQPVSVLFVVMSAYLAISLVTSLLMNLYNRRVQIKER